MGVEDRFFKKVQKSDGCWEWTAYRHRDGYGRFRIAGRSEYAHRMAWRFRHGDIPPGMQVLHHCDNPKCVNPDHLFLGTHDDNMADKVAKNRQAHNRIRGEASGTAKLSARDVIQIRYLYSVGAGSQRLLAKRFGISQGQIGRIVNNEKWSHL